MGVPILPIPMNPIGPVVIYASSTIWVCTVRASNRPASSVTRVCHTIVLRPRCSGVVSARTTPSRPPAKRLVFDSSVVVVPGGRFSRRPF
jgi:hypothetical protein